MSDYHLHRYKPGSRIQSVWEVFLTKGPKEAFEFGGTLGLKVVTLNHWCRVWGRETGKAVQIDSAAKTARKSRTVESTKPRYKLSKKSNRTFIIIEAGDQQSLCRWTDTGEDQCMVNSWMIPADEATREKKKIG